jgi:hypothetical protein
MTMPDVNPFQDWLPEKVSLPEELRGLIRQSRERVAVTVNSELTRLNRMPGKRIPEKVLLGGRAQYGTQTIRKLSIWLVAEYGSGYSVTNLTHPVEPARVCPGEQIIY